MVSKEWIDKNIGGKRVEVIPHGTTIPKEVKPLPSDYTVGYLGALGPDKGVLYLILAWDFANN